MTRAATVHRDELTTLRMVAGNEKLFPKVIVHGEVIEWVGIGWIRIDKASPLDYRHYPTVTE